MLREVIERATARSTSTPASTRQVAQIVVSFRGSIIDVVHIDQDSSAYTVGEAPEASFKLNGAALPDPGATPLVQRIGSGFMVMALPGFEGTAQHVELRCDAKLTLRCGEVRFDIALVEREAVEAGRTPLDRPFLASIVGTGMLATAALVLMQSMPIDSMSVALEEAEAQARFASYFKQANELDEPEPLEAEVESTNDSGEASPAAATPSRSPRARPSGGPSSKNLASGGAPRGPRGGQGLSRDALPGAMASDAGVLGILAQQGVPLLAAAPGAFGDSEADALLWGNAQGLADYGIGGLSASNGYVPGGTGSELVSLGAIGPIGTGTGTDGLAYRGTIRHEDRKPKRPQTIVQEPEAPGNVDKDVIRRIVRAHINEIRHCYNAGLTRDPNLSGRVKVQFTILSSGKVAGAIIEQNSTNDSEVGHCITKAIKRWKFSGVVRGGAAALVSYPFVLRMR